MPKKVSEIKIKEMVKAFNDGQTIQALSEKFNCTKSTIARHLKKNIKEEDYKTIVKKNKREKESEVDLNKTSTSSLALTEYLAEDNVNEDYSYQESSFMEILPVDYEIDKNPQKDLTSIPISEVDFPKTVYMVVNKKIELETKILKDYPDWQFLSQNELSKKTIEIHLDIKIAKKICTNEQKVIKVPNTKVFRIVAPILISRGISRIVSANSLIAL